MIYALIVIPILSLLQSLHVYNYSLSKFSCVVMQNYLLATNICRLRHGLPSVPQSPYVTLLVQIAYMEMHVLSTLAYENKKEKKGNPPNCDPDKQTYSKGYLDANLHVYML